MQQKLIDHSPDLKKLSEEGYDLEINGGHLLVHHIPYLDSSLEINHGTIVTELTLATPSSSGKPKDHTVFFQGKMPCNIDGTVIKAILNSSNNQVLTGNIMVNHRFSSKPSSGIYPDYYEKIRTYAEIISSQAKAKNKAVTAKPNQKK